MDTKADAVIVRAARERSQHQEKPVNSLDRVRESLTFSRDKNFEREAVVDERALIRDGLRRGMGEITHAGQVVGPILDSSIGFPRISNRRASSQRSRPSVHHRQNLSKRNMKLSARMREGQNHAKPVLPRQHAIARADQHSHLNHGNKKPWSRTFSVRRTAFKGNPKDSHKAKPGKTTTLAVIRSVAGKRRAIRLRAFAPTSALHANSRRQESKPELYKASCPRPRIQMRLTSKRFYFVDESSASKHKPNARVSSRGLVPMTADASDRRYSPASGASMPSRPFEQLQRSWDAHGPTR